MSDAKLEIEKSIRKFLKLNLSEDHMKSTLELLLKFQSENYQKDKKIMSNNEIKILREQYKNMIIEMEGKIQGEIEIENIKKLVSFVSSNQEMDSIIDESPVLKSIRIFESVNEVFLLYTSESQGQFLSLKDKLEEKKIIVNEIKCTIDNITDIYNKIRELSIKGEINPDNTLLDITLGQRFVGVSLYKVSVERGIRAINWKTDFIQKYRIEDDGNITMIKGSGRFPMGATLELMIEPRKENHKIYEQINESIENYNFQATSMLYSQLGEKEMSQFYFEMSQLYSLNTFFKWDFYSVKDAFAKFIKKVEKIELSPILREKCSDFLTLIFALTLEETEDIDDNPEDGYIEFSEKEKNFINKFSLDRDKLYEYMDYLKYDPEYELEDEYEDYEDRKFIMKELVFQFIRLYYLSAILKDENEIRKIFKSTANLKIENLKFPEIQLMKNYELEVNDIEWINSYIPFFTLKEVLKKSFVFKDGVLEIGKFNIKIDIAKLAKKRTIEIKELKKEKEGKLPKDEETNVFKIILGKSKNAQIIRYILNSDSHKIAGVALYDFILENSDASSDKAKVDLVRKTVSITKKLADQLNEEFEKIDSRLHNFIDHDDKGLYPELVRNHSIYINKKFIII